MTYTKITDSDIDTLMNDKSGHPFPVNLAFAVTPPKIAPHLQFHPLPVLPKMELSRAKQSQVMMLINNYVATVDPVNFAVPREFDVKLAPFLGNTNYLMLRLIRWLWNDGVSWDIPEDEPVPTLLKDYLEAAKKAGL